MEDQSVIKGKLDQIRLVKVSHLGILEGHVKRGEEKRRKRGRRR